MATAKVAKKPILIKAGEFTLDELDEVQKLIEDETCGRMVAIAHVFFRRGGHAKSIDSCRKLTFRDVEIDMKDPTDEEVEASPTSPGPSSHEPGE